MSISRYTLARVALARTIPVSGGTTHEVAVIFGTALGIASVVNAILEASAIFSTSQSADSGPQAVLSAALALPTSLSFDVSNIATLQASVAYALDAGDQFSGDILGGPVTHEASLSIGVVQSIEFITVSNLFAAVQFGSSLALTVSGGTDISAAVSFAVNHAVINTVSISIEGAVNFEVQQAVTQAASASLNADTVLAQQVGVQLVAGAILEAGLDLSCIVSMDVVGNIISLGMVTPDGRTIIINIEDRTIVVPRADDDIDIN